MEDDVRVFGFWVYLMTDLVIFAALFATYLVLKDGAFGGPTAHDLFEMPTVVQETLILLTSSFTCSLATFSIFRQKKGAAIFWFFVTFLLGLSFLYIELSEFAQFIGRNASWQRSAFLSAFFTLVGTHGLHILCGLLWMAILMVHLFLRPLSTHINSQIFRLAYFWHFLDFVWIFIFTVVYGMGLL